MLTGPAPTGVRGTVCDWSALIQRVNIIKYILPSPKLRVSWLDAQFSPTGPQFYPVPRCEGQLWGPCVCAPNAELRELPGLRAPVTQMAGVCSSGRSFHKINLTHLDGN